MDKPRFIDMWVNCPDRAVAEKIASAAISGQLAACANIYPAIRSIYRWQGAVEAGDEVPLMLKSRAELFDPLAALVKRLHPFEVPSIVATELCLVETDYAGWMANETMDGDTRP